MPHEGDVAYVDVHVYENMKIRTHTHTHAHIHTGGQAFRRGAASASNSVAASLTPAAARSLREFCTPLGRVFDSVQ